MEPKKTGAAPLGGPFVPDEFLVKFIPGTPAESKKALLAAQNVREKEVIRKIDVHVLQVPPGKTVSAMVGAYQKNPNIDYAEPNYICSADLIPNDPYFLNAQKPLQKIKAPEAWDQTTGSAEIIVAVLDTGAFYGHEDLVGRLIPGYNFINNNTNAEDDHGHGTRVAGVIGARTHNGKGVAGTTWLNPMLPLKVLASDGFGSYSGLAQGIIYATDKGARVINMSLGGSSSSQALKDAIDYAYKRNVVLLAAAGNTNSSVDYPAAYPYVIAVAAVDNSDNKASYSCFGPEISVAAPGNGVFSTVRTGGYDLASGTSMATPFVSGLAALILGLKPSLTSLEVQTIIEAGAEDLGDPGWDPYFGWGRINMERSISHLELPNLPPPQDTEPPSVTIFSPQEGAKVAGTVQVEMQATDNVAVEKVDLLINGNVICTLHNSPYLFAWHTDNIEAGAYSLAARATDTSGNWAFSTTITIYKEQSPIGEIFTFTGSIGNKKQGSQAEHSIDIKSVGVVSAILTWATKKTDIDLYLYDADGQLLAKSTQSTAQNMKEELSTNIVKPGIYRFKIIAISGNTSYTLTVNTP